MMNVNLLKDSIINIKIPHEMKERIICRCYTKKEQKSNGWFQYCLRKKTAISCACIVIVAFLLGLFSFTKQKHDNEWVNFFLNGLTITTYAIEMPDKSMEWDVQVLEKYETITVSVSDGYLSKSKDAIHGEQNLVLNGSDSFYWYADEFQGCEMYVSGKHGSQITAKAVFVVEKSNDEYTPVIQFLETHPRLNKDK